MRLIMDERERGILNLYRPPFSCFEIFGVAEQIPKLALIIGRLLSACFIILFGPVVSFGNICRGGTFWTKRLWSLFLFPALLFTSFICHFWRCHFWPSNECKSAGGAEDPISIYWPYLLKLPTEWTSRWRGKWTNKTHKLTKLKKKKTKRLRGKVSIIFVFFGRRRELGWTLNFR